MISVLHVDDEPALMDVTKLFLERDVSIRVTTTTSVSSAMGLLSTQKFDAIISDYEMPETDGIEFLKTVRGEGDDTPFIIFTGRGREQVVIEALNRGADFYLQKGGDPKSQFGRIKEPRSPARAEKKGRTCLTEERGAVPCGGREPD